MSRLRRHALECGENEYSSSDSAGVLGEMLCHVKQMNEEIHTRHVASDADEQYKSEWRMVALVLDRILLILFFTMTVFTCVVIFVNVPY